MAKYKAYPEYKDSGVEWLGEIPDHWPMKKISWYFSAEKGKKGQLLTKEYCGSHAGIYPVYSGQTENNGTMGFIDSYEFNTEEDGVLFSTTVGAKAMSLNHLKGKFSLSQNCMIILPKNKNALIRFFFYHFQPLFQHERSLIPEHMQASFRMEDLYQYSIALPPKNEQLKITKFLDHETAKIDNLIEKQQQLIELLKEKRQAVISHAVTKGLNPDVLMKDSGVEWLGDVPEHWEVKRIKHFGKVIGGFAFKSTDFTDEGYPVIKISNVSHLSFDWGDSSFLPPSFSFTHKEYLAPNGALVFAMTRPVISGGIKVTLLDDDSAPLVNQRVGFMMVRSKNMARYILISTQSSAFLAHFVNNMTVTNQPNISSEGIESIYLPVPPMNEISRILLYVDRMNESYNQLIDRALLQVSLLQERRTALISAAVTGKIDVRDWVAPDTQDVEEPQEATA